MTNPQQISAAAPLDEISSTKTDPPSNFFLSANSMKPFSFVGFFLCTHP
jgi:hypothetical protein